MAIPINYIEFSTNNLNQTKAFYRQVFEWEFEDYGPHYAAFTNAGIDGGFEQIEGPIHNGTLVVLKNKNLESLITKVKTAGGKISKEIFEFPGGKRFQFTDPSGNELAVWTE